MAESIVYFIRRESDGATKIGTTTNLAQRVSALQRQHGQLKVLGVVEGAATIEKLVHVMFSAQRLDGEFFQETAVLREFREKYATEPPLVFTGPPRSGTGWKASKSRPWIDLYSDPLVVYERDQFVRDYESWIEQGLIAPTKSRYLPIFKGFPSKIVFVPQPGQKRNWGWTPLNPHCWADVNRRRLYYG
jgi:hypothetical protein